MGAIAHIDDAIILPDKFKHLFVPSRYKAVYGGRGSAKSHSIARALLIKGAEEQKRILCAREIQKSIAASSKKLLDDLIDKYSLGHFYNSTNSRIVGANGTEFMFAGLRTNVDSVKSMEGLDIAWVEEAHNVPQASLDVLEPTLRGEESEVWYSWNPRFTTDPVDFKFRGGEAPPGSIIIPAHWYDNPYFPNVLRREMEWQRRRDIDKFNHIWLGHYQISSESRVFRNWKIDDFITPDDAIFYYGADWGFATDPTVLVRTWLDPDNRTLYIDREAWQVGCEIDHTPRLFDTIPNSRRWKIRADSARPETISYMQRNGFNVIGARKGAGSVEEGVTFLQSCNIVVHPSCKHVIDELTYYSYKVDPLTEEVLPVLEDKKNHTVDAVRYALEEVRNKSHWVT